MMFLSPKARVRRTATTSTRLAAGTGATADRRDHRPGRSDHGATHSEPRRVTHSEPTQATERTVAGIEGASAPLDVRTAASDHPNAVAVATVTTCARPRTPIPTGSVRPALGAAGTPTGIRKIETTPTGGRRSSLSASATCSSVVRVVLTVALVVAIVGIAVPAVEWAGVQRSDATVRGAVDELVGEARALAQDSDALPPSAAPARRTLALEFPREGFASAPLTRLTIGPPAGSTVEGAAAGGRGQPNGTRIAWRVAGGATHVTQVPELTIRAATSVRDKGATATPTQVIGSGGRHSVRLELVRVDGRRVVRLSVDGT